METLICHLHVFHPYNTLKKTLDDAEFSDCLEDAWKFTNDTYHTNAILLYQPHVITLAAVFFAARRKGKEKELIKYYTNLNIEMQQIGEVILDVLEVYDMWTKTFDEEIYRVMTQLPRVQQPKPQQQKKT